MKTIGVITAVLSAVALNFAAFIPPVKAPSPPVAQVNAAEDIFINAELKRICGCESGTRSQPRHYAADGSVLVSSTNDIGICQINEKAHGAQAHAMGFDLRDESDNIRYANWLYQTSGANPWSASFPCWKHPQP